MICLSERLDSISLFCSRVNYTDAMAEGSTAASAARAARGKEEAPHRCAEALGNDLGWALGMAFRLYAKTAEAVTAELPGGPRGFQVLAAAADDQAGTQLALAQQLGVDRTVMTYLLDDLERAGLVTRVPDPADRRARHVRLTDQGLATFRFLEERLRQVEAHVLAPLDGAERDTFRSLLQRIANRAGALAPVANPCDLAAEMGEAVR
jgi:DNA-binding MarR family transcriptional regulator